jgi:hypothetical protein
MQSAGFILWDLKRSFMSWWWVSPKHPTWLQLAVWTGALKVEVLVVEVTRWEEARRVVVDLRMDVDVETAWLHELEVWTEEEGRSKDTEADVDVETACFCELEAWTEEEGRSKDTKVDVDLEVDVERSV